jgi:leader peptidase (prepilin peptidase)/N-methyltransferase
VTLPWIIAAASAGLLAGPRMRASVLFRSTEGSDPPRRGCPACADELLPARRPWRSLLPLSGRCPSCRARIGPYPLVAELAAAVALGIVAARSPSVWELAALSWLALLAVPLACVDVAVHRLPNPLTAAACAGTLVLLAVAALTSHQPGQLGRAVVGAAALVCFYLALFVIRPGGIGLGDAKLAASVGAVLAWVSWQALVTGTFAAFTLAAIYGAALLFLHRATRSTHMPFGPFILLGALAAIAL